MFKTLTLVAAFGCLCAPAQAQLITEMDTEHAASIEIGADSGLVSRVGYHHRLRPAAWPHALQLRARFTVPVAGLDLQDNRFEAGARTTLVGWGRWRLQAALDGVAMSTENVAFSANALGLRAALLPGYQSARWGLMADLSYEAMLGTHIRPSARYKQKVFSEAESGWYSATAGTLQLGLRGGARLGPVELSARLGLMTTQAGNLHLPPFYATLGAAYGF